MKKVFIAAVVFIVAILFQGLIPYIAQPPPDESECIKRIAGSALGREVVEIKTSTNSIDVLVLTGGLSEPKKGITKICLNTSRLVQRLQDYPNVQKIRIWVFSEERNTPVFIMSLTSDRFAEVDWRRVRKNIKTDYNSMLALADNHSLKEDLWGDAGYQKKVFHIKMILNEDE